MAQSPESSARSLPPGLGVLADPATAATPHGGGRDEGDPILLVGLAEHPLHQLRTERRRRSTVAGDPAAIEHHDPIGERGKIQIVQHGEGDDPARAT